MQDDDFQEFEQAQPSPDTLSPPHSSPLPISPPSAPEGASGAHPLLLIEAPFSQMANFPSEQDDPRESGDAGEEVWPPLNKMESQSVVPSSQGQINFSKTQSQRDLSKQESDPFDLLAFETAPPPTQGSYSEQFSVSSVGLEQDLAGPNLAPAAGDGLLSMNLGGAEEVAGSKQDYGLLFNEQPLIIEESQSNPSPRKESEDFVFQYSEPKEEAGNQIPGPKQEEGEVRKQSEDFVFQSEEPVAEEPLVGEYSAIAEEVPEQAGNNIQLVFQEHPIQTNGYSELNDQREGEVRKQSDEFYFQDPQPAQESQDFELLTAEPQQGNPFQEQTQTSNPNELKNQCVPEAPVDLEPSIESYPETPVQNNLQNSTQPQLENKQQTALLPEQEEEDDDDFGQFQQTQPAQDTVEDTIGVPEARPKVPEAGEKQVPQERPKVPEAGEKQVEVKIDGSLAPYDLNVEAKERELKEFVASLPDYSFLLATAFRTV